jgi:diguanylate cyclase
MAARRWGVVWVCGLAIVPMSVSAAPPVSELARSGEGMRALVPMKRVVPRPQAVRPRPPRRAVPRSARLPWLESLPRGRLLPDHLWRRRHRAITLLLWLQVPVLALFGLARGMGLDALVDVGVLAGFALVAGSSKAGRTVRSIAGSVGLVSASAILVHFWSGTIEAHFAFFVVISLLMLYQDWVPFLIAIGFVVVHHGIVGALAPTSVYAHGAAHPDPWKWALIHGGFVVAAAAANLVSWRANEQLLRDPLTGLASRLVLQDRVRAALERVRRHGRAVAVLFVDLDRFKVLNDSLGHAAGDQVLRALADRLRHCTHGSDVAVRFGGDEFVLVCEDLEGPDAAAAIADRLGALMREPVVLGERSHVMTVSIGVAVTTDPDRVPEELVRDADAAMYRAKELGKNRSELFDEAMHADVRRRLDVEAGLRTALERDELRLHYQPEVELASGRVLAVEALLRWEHPERGLLAPGEFIAVAEDTGLIVPIGAWVIGEACRQSAAWGDTPVTMRVNLSARQLRDPGLVDVIREALAETGIGPHALCLELTESMLMQDVERSAAVLGELRAMGVRLALDDFGTGYSSLAYLRHLHVDRLKVDRSFMAEFDGQPAEQTIVAAIIGMARGLGLAVTAEGIETPEQLERLRALGCDAVQGFLLARPAEPAAIEHLLHTTLGRPAFQLGMGQAAAKITPPGGSATRASAPTSP